MTSDILDSTRNTVNGIETVLFDPDLPPVMIKFGEPGPGGKLSNLVKREFVFQGIPCGSSEGFLQSLKFKDDMLRRKIALKHGMKAKRSGSGKRLDRKGQIAYWKGITIDRTSIGYNKLIRDMYLCLTRSNSEYLDALLETGLRPLVHPLGSSNILETVLTEREFCQILYEIRNLFTLKTREEFSQALLKYMRVDAV